METEIPREPPSILVGGGHLAALWALAVVQPLLSLLGSNPDFFVARDNTGGQIVLFALLVTLAPPLLATGMEALLNLMSGRARWAFHLFLVALLFALLVIQVFKQIADGPAVPMIIVAVLAGVALAWAYGYRNFLRSLTDILIPAPIIILVVFLFFSEASELTTSSNDVEALKASIGNPAPVVMLIFDEFPVGSLMTPDLEVNAKRFPHFAELEANSNWYRNTVTDASYTAIAVPSILTGKSADRSSLPTAADHPDSIFTLLGGSYGVNAVEPITQLCPTSVCGERDGGGGGALDALSALFGDLKFVSAHLNLPEDMSVSLPDISQSFQGFGSGAPTESVERGRARQFVADKLDEGHASLDGEADVADMLAAREPAPDHAFDLAHVEEPHYPWTHYPDGLRYSEQTEDFRAIFTEEEWLDDGYPTERARQAHLLEVGFADYLLGQVMDRVKSDGLWDETLFVVAADHGGAMVKGIHRREANPETMGQIAMVPFFVKAPGQKRGRVVDRVQCVTDILPAMAKQLGVEVPWDSPVCNRDEVELDNGTGPKVTLPMDQVLAQRDEYIGILSDLFGGDTGFDDVLKLGPNQDLIGTATGSLNVAPEEGGASATPEVGGDLATNLQPEIPLNPVLRQRGVLKGVDEDTPLAVSVNGRIAAVGQAYRDGNRLLYSILLPRRPLRAGPNDIELLRVEPDAGWPDLTVLWTNADAR